MVYIGMNHHHSIKRKKEDDDDRSPSSASTYSNHHQHATGSQPNMMNTTAVVYSPRNVSSNATLSWTQCKTHLHTMLQQYGNDNDDPILEDIATISTQSSNNSMKRSLLDVPVALKIQTANDMVSSMESEMEQITTQVQNVSTIVSSLQSQYDTLLSYYTTQQYEMEELQQQQQRYENQIQLYQHSLQQHQRDTEVTHQDLYHSVPRLQHMISLYVSMTGIKWKYDENENRNHNSEDGTVALTGEIVRIYCCGVGTPIESVSQFVLPNHSFIAMSSDAYLHEFRYFHFI